MAARGPATRPVPRDGAGARRVAGTGSLVADYGDGSAESPAHRDEIVPARARAPQNVIGGWALAGFALSCGWALYASVVAIRPVDIVTAPTVTVLVAKPAAPVAAPVLRKSVAITGPDFLRAPQVDASMFGADALGASARRLQPDRAAREHASAAATATARCQHPDARAPAGRGRAAHAAAHGRRVARRVLARFDRQHPGRRHRVREDLRQARAPERRARLRVARRRRLQRWPEQIARQASARRRHHRRLRHHGARRLHAGRHAARSAFRPRRQDGRSALRQRAHARRDAAAHL